MEKKLVRSVMILDVMMGIQPCPEDGAIRDVVQVIQMHPSRKAAVLSHPRSRTRNTARGDRRSKGSQKERVTEIESNNRISQPEGGGRRESRELDLQWIGRHLKLLIKKKDVSPSIESGEGRAATASVPYRIILSASSDNRCADGSSRNENKGGKRDEHVIVGSQSSQVSIPNGSTRPVPSHDDISMQQKENNRRNFQQKRHQPRWLRQSIPFPPVVVPNCESRTGNLLYRERRFTGTQYHPYNTGNCANGKWNGMEWNSKGTWLKENHGHQGGSRRFRSFTYNQTLDYNMPVPFSTQFSRPYMPELHHPEKETSKGNVYRRRNRRQNNYVKAATQGRSLPMESGNFHKTLGTSADTEAEQHVNGEGEGMPFLSSDPTKSTSPCKDSEAVPDDLPDTDGEVSTSTDTVQEEVKFDNKREPLDGNTSSKTIESHLFDELSQEVVQLEEAAEKYDIENLCDSVIKDLGEIVDYRTNRLLRVMLDLLHPDARSLTDSLGISCQDFYNLCSRISKLEFNAIREIDTSNVDGILLQRLYEELCDICRSILVPLLAQKAYLADNIIDFTRMDLDIIEIENFDPYKELALIFAITDDFRSVPELKEKDACGWLDKCDVMKEMFDAFMADDKQKLKQLGVTDTAETVAEKIELGLAISDQDITTMLRDSINSDFGEYTWLVERYPQLIRTPEHFDCIMESIPLMEKCVDIRPLRRTLEIIPKLLSGLNPDECDSCVARHLNRHEVVRVAKSWVQLLRNSNSTNQLVMELTTQFLFRSTKYGAEEFLGVLLDNIPVDSKVEAIKCVDRLPPCLRDILLSDSSDKASLYAATKLMTEEMPVLRFKKEAVFLISNLCEYSSLSPSKFLSIVFFRMMSTPAKAKAALAISSLVKHRKFKKEVMEGPVISPSDLLTFALEQYEPPLTTTGRSRYTFIESMFSAVRELLSDDTRLVVDMNEIFDKFQNITWYQKLVISTLLCDAIGPVSIAYPWKCGVNVVKNLQTLRELPFILTSWPSDNSRLFENFIKDNFEPDDADLLSQVMLLSLDRDEDRLKEDVHVFANSIYGISHVSYNWEEMLVESEKESESKDSEDPMSKPIIKGLKDHELDLEKESAENPDATDIIRQLMISGEVPEKAELRSQRDGGEDSKKKKQSKYEDWNTEELFDQKAEKHQILQDLRTFTWALDTLEKWSDCPTSVREKVLLMAANCHCDLVKARASRIERDTSLN
nr:Protein D2005.4 [Haemonchus contortus]